METIIKRIIAITIVAVLTGNSTYALGAEKTLKDYQERTKQDVAKINASTSGLLGSGGYVATAIIAAGSVGALWAIHTKMLRQAASKKIQAEEAMLKKALQARDAALELADSKDIKLNKIESSKKLAEKARRNAEGALIEERAALNIVKQRLNKAYQSNLLEGAAYIHAYRTQTPELAKYLDAGGPDRVYANIEGFELSENIKLLASDRKTAPFAKELQALLETLPKDGSDIAASYYVKKAEIYNTIKASANIPQLKLWLEESIVKEDLPFILSASKNMTTFVESVRDYEAKGQVSLAREVIENAVREEPSIARVLPRTFKRFGTVAVLFAGAFVLHDTASAASDTRVGRIRSNPSLFLQADGDTLSRVSQDKELSNALILMSNSIHEISLMPKAQMKKFLTSVISDQELKKRQINLSVPLKKPVDFAKYGSLRGM